MKLWIKNPKNNKRYEYIPWFEQILTISNFEYGVIYRIYNKTTGKSYIGQTTDIFKRLKSHWLISNKKCIKIARAIQKYNRECFSVQILKICKNKVELDAFEEHFIVLFDSILNGYNLKTGGSFGKLSSESIEKMKKTKAGRKLTEEHKLKIKQNNKSKLLCSKPIICVNDNKQFDSITDASKFYNLPKNQISAVLNGLYDKAKGLHFKYLNEEFNNKKIKKLKYRKILNELKKQKIKKNAGKYRQKKIKDQHNNIYINISSAAKQLHLTTSNICKVLKGQRQHTGGYKFSYVK